MGHPGEELSGLLPARTIPPETPFVPSYRYNPEKLHSGTISSYRDNVIDLEIAIWGPNFETSGRYINLAHFEEGLTREFIRAYCWCAMNLELDSMKLESIAPSRLKKEVLILCRYVTFMNDRGVPLAKISDRDNDAWIAIHRQRSYSTLVRAAAIPKRLHWYRHYLPVKVNEREPWQNRGPRHVLGPAPTARENATERVPRSIMEPMLSWALFYVQSASKDIFELIRHSDGKRWTCGPAGMRSYKFACIPGTQVPWRRIDEDYEFRDEIRHLVTACYIVVGYLSGMRDGEVQSIGEGATSVKRDEAGRPYRWLVKARGNKNRRTERSQIRTFVVVEEVHRAIEAVEQLQAVMAETSPDPADTMNGNLLFRRYSSLRFGGGPHTHKDAAVRGDMAKWLKQFQAHVGALSMKARECAQTEHDRKVLKHLYRVPPLAEGQPWPWITKHLRRTIAWYIANEPFGIVAGKRQFGHIRETTYQGYAGSVEAGFRDEVDRARAVGQVRDILDLYDHVEAGGRLGGPKGRFLEKELRSIAREAADLSGQIVDDKRLMQMLKNIAKEVYPGLINDCFFDADVAVCLQRAKSADRSRPLFAQCDWENCPNSCFWAKHVPALRLSLADVRHHRRQRGLSKNQRFALDALEAKYVSALEKLRGG